MELHQWLEDTGTTPSQMSKALGVAIQTVYRWRDRQRFPAAKHMLAIQEYTRGSVRPSDFFARFESVEKNG